MTLVLAASVRDGLLLMTDSRTEGDPTGSRVGDKCFRVAGCLLGTYGGGPVGAPARILALGHGLNDPEMLAQRVLSEFTKDGMPPLRALILGRAGSKPVAVRVIVNENRYEVLTNACSQFGVWAGGVTESPEVLPGWVTVSPEKLARAEVRPILEAIVRSTARACPDKVNEDVHCESLD